MSDPLTSSLLDDPEERKRSTPAASTTSYSLYSEESQDKSLVAKYCSSRRNLVIFTAVTIIILLAILVPFAVSASGHGEPVVPSTDTSSSSATPPPVAWSSTGQREPLYQANLTLAGVPVFQYGQGERVVLVMPNVFGIGADLWNLSTSYAMAGYRAYAVDIFRGDPMPRAWEEAWWDRHLYNDTVAVMQGVVDAVRADTTVTSLQVVGFCYGGGVAAGMLAMARPVKSAVSAHPTFLNHGLATLGNLSQRVQGSVFFVMPSNDEFNADAAQWINAMWRRNIAAAFDIYPGTSHGRPSHPHPLLMLIAADLRLTRDDVCVCRVVRRLCVRPASGAWAACEHEGAVNPRHPSLAGLARPPAVGRRREDLEGAGSAGRMHRCVTGSEGGRADGDRTLHTNVCDSTVHHSAPDCPAQGEMASRNITES